MEGKELIIGTYESFLFGYRINRNLDESYTLETSFTDDSHRGALRCLSISPSGVLTSSSTDDSLRLHNLLKRKEIGALFEHTGTINSITFFRSSHMFSASEDGTICMWKCKNWEMLRSFKGHKSRVIGFAVHPSGKLGLSIGSDKSFLTWDLVTGKLAFQRKIKDVAQNIYFTSDGNHYVLVYQKLIEMCSLETTKTVKEVSTDWRINTTCFVEDNIMAVGGDHQFVLIIDILNSETLIKLDVANPEDKSFNSRVKCIAVVDSDDGKLIVIATASGNVKVFKLSLKDNFIDYTKDIIMGLPMLKAEAVDCEKIMKKAEMILFYETKLRVTCMGVYGKGSVDENRALEGVKMGTAGRTEVQTERVKPQKQKAVPKPVVHKTSEDIAEASDSQITKAQKSKMRKRKVTNQSPEPSHNKKQKVGKKQQQQQGTGRIIVDPNHKEGSASLPAPKKKAKRTHLLTKDTKLL